MPQAKPRGTTLRRPRRTEEDDVMRALIELCRRLGFLVFHDNDPVRNLPGFPDIVIAGYGVVIIIEMKTDRNDLTSDQRAWINAFLDAGCDARVYRTSSWRTQDLVRELTGVKRAWMRRGLPRREQAPLVDLPGIAARSSRYARCPTQGVATILAASVPDLLEMIEYLTGKVESASSR